MTNPFAEEIQVALPWLSQELGFRINSQEYHYRAMGSAIVGLDSTDVPVRLRFVRDQLGVVAQVASISDLEWANVYRVLEAIHGEVPNADSTLDDQATLFRKHLPELTEAMGPKWAETKDELERLHQLRLRAAMTPRPISWGVRLKLMRLRWRRTAFLLLGLAVAAGLLFWIASR